MRKFPTRCACMNPFTKGPTAHGVLISQSDKMIGDYTFVSEDGRLPPKFEAILDKDKHAIVSCGYCGQNAEPEQDEPQSVKEALGRPVLVQVKDALGYPLSIADAIPVDADDSDKLTLSVTYGWLRECRDVLKITEAQLANTQKGELHGTCNRTACESHLPATHYNSSTRMHYCIVCARTINEFNPGLCVPVVVKVAVGGTTIQSMAALLHEVDDYVCNCDDKCNGTCTNSKIKAMIEYLEAGGPIPKTQGKPELITYLEDCAAIADRFFTHKRQQEFYTAFAGQLSGFPGVWKFVAHAAKVFTELQSDYNEIDWIASTESYADLIMAKALDGKDTGDIQNETWLLLIANQSLVQQ